MRVEPSRFRAGDLIDEAVAGALQRRGRSMLTALGAALGVGAFVAVLGLTSTAGSQISRRFSVLQATEVTVEQVRPEGSAHLELAFPDDADRRIGALSGVREAGVLWTVGTVRLVSAIPPTSLRAGADDIGEQITVLAASAGALRATRPRLVQGVIYDEFHESRAERVAVVGAAIARRLGIGRLDAQPAVFLDGVPLSVIGIIDDVQRRTDALFAVLVPRRTAEALWGRPTGDDAPRMLIETQLGAAQVVGQQAPLALRPDAPELFKTLVPADPRSLRERVATDLDELFLLLAAICLVISAIGIANTTLVAVLERVPEIGLRRALGARPVHIATQFIAESGALGTLGGLIGMSAGVVMVVTVAAARQWTPALEAWTVIPAPLLGSITGLLAGLYPALRAAQVEPVEALRR